MAVFLLLVRNPSQTGRNIVSVTLLEQRRRERLVSTRTLFPPGVSLSENYVAKFLVARRAGNTSRYSRLHSNRDSGRCMHIWWNNTNAAPGFHRDDFAPDTTLHHTKHILSMFEIRPPSPFESDSCNDGGQHPLVPTAHLFQ